MMAADKEKYCKYCGGHGVVSVGIGATRACCQVCKGSGETMTTTCELCAAAKARCENPACPQRTVSKGKKFCKDCKYFKLVPHADHHSTCGHEDAKDLVMGEAEYADLERWPNHACGPAGNNWRAKQ